MKKKVAVISGGSRGIGKETVLAFAREGYTVCFLYEKNIRAAQEVISKSSENKFDVEAYKCDVSNKKKVEEIFENIYKKHKFIDVLVNNAGIAEMSLFTDISEEKWDRIFNVNVKGTYNCCQAVINKMISEKKGNIINIASIWGMVGAACETHYSATKGAIIAFTKALAKEEGLSNIRVNAVSPGAIMTDMIKDISEDEIKLFKEDIPLNRLGTAKEIADIILFLADEKSSYITGQVISPNGGVVI